MNVESSLNAVDAAVGSKSASTRRLRYLAPVVVFVALAGLLGWGLNRDPREIPSP